MQDITQIEEKLMRAADQLRSYPKHTSTQYCMPILVLIFLRFAYNKYLVVKTEIEKNLPKRNGVTWPFTKDVMNSLVFVNSITLFMFYTIISISAFPLSEKRLYVYTVSKIIQI